MCDAFHRLGGACEENVVAHLVDAERLTDGLLFRARVLRMGRFEVEECLWGHASMVAGAYDIRYYPARMVRRLVWSEVRDLLDIAACESVDELLEALRTYQADPPLPNEPVD